MWGPLRCGMVLDILGVVGAEGVYCILATLCVCYGFVCDIRFLRCLVWCGLTTIVQSNLDNVALVNRTP